MSGIQQGLIASYPAPTGGIPTYGLVNEWLLHSDANDTVGSANLTTSGITYGTVGGKSAATYSTNAYATNTSYTITQDNTISFWMYLSDFNDTQYILKLDGGHPSIYFAFRPSEPTSFFIYESYSSARAMSFPRSDLTVNSWQMITLATSGVTSKSYLGDTLKVTTSADYDYINSQNLNIGGYDTSSGYNPHGSIRDVRIWNRELTQQEITDIYNIG